MNILSTFEVLMVLITAVLVIQTFILLCHPWFRRRRSRPATMATSVPADVFPGIPVAEHASVEEQRVLMDQLAVLPQIRRLPDGSLVDWVSGSRLMACECRHGKAHPHLQLQWMGDTGLGMVSRTGLAHYLGYQQRIAQVLSRQNGAEGGAR